MITELLLLLLLLLLLFYFLLLLSFYAVDTAVYKLSQLAFVVTLRICFQKASSSDLGPCTAGPD